MIYSDYYYYKINSIIIKLYKINQAQTNKKIISRIQNNS